MWRISLLVPADILDSQASEVAEVEGRTLAGADIPAVGILVD